MTDTKRILFLTAEPTETARLRLGQELREIEEKLQRARHGAMFQLKPASSARPGNVSQELLEFAPHIVHFSGHGASTGELCFEDVLGRVQPVTPQALAALFKLVANQVECVILNACYSDIQAEAIVQHIPFVIGMNTAIGDQAAIAFSVGFYKALSANRSPQEAFKFGCAEIQLEGISEELTPVLRQKIVKSSPDNFYVERPSIEQRCYEEIQKPGAFIRIKAPDKMGKKSLTNRILSYARDEKNYQTVTLNCSQLINHQTTTDIKVFLQTFCTAVTRKLELRNQVDELWNHSYTHMDNTGDYFQNYLLSNIDNDLVLALHEVDLIFEQSQISADFCSLLRNFYDIARRGTRNSRIWEKLRLIIVHSTEVYAALDINSSPITGVGLVVDLPEFEQEQVQRLVNLYKLQFNPNQIAQLMAMLGGHPHLLQTGINNIKLNNKSIEQFLQEAPTLAGAFNHHLQELLATLENNLELKTAFIQVISADENNPVKLHPKMAMLLQRFGLVKFEGNFVKPRCKLYQLFFREFL
jgi:AAA-like domain/CHAT domain